ncbi:MAG TPA: MurR/RpiR family transcriptional regulator [Acidimicrobiales bacterium]|nr:MurR/RpiR family transcriptional regulator [Acidimicrobiales bacterium]
MTVVERIMAHADRLTTTERKIASVLADEPQIIAFGTVAQVAQRAGTSGPSVVRLASKLGYDGFVGLQAAIQAELALRLGPARDRIRQHLPDDLLGRIQTGELDNVSSTFHNLSREAVGRAADLLADLARRVWIYPGELTAPIGTVLATLLGQLRPGVSLLAGSELAIGRALADLAARDVVVAIDIHRYERSLASAVEWASSLGAEVLAVTDGPLSPLAGMAAETFFFSARGVGPFDSMVGGVALADVIVGAVAARVRATAAGRLDAIETAWTSWKALVAEPAVALEPIPLHERPAPPEGSEPARPRTAAPD